MPANHPRIGHTSVYADDPFGAASSLAGLIGGVVAPFDPLPGGFVCFLDASRTEWSHEFVEFYPRTVQLLHELDRPRPKFFAVEGGASGAGSHVNIVLPVTSAEIDAMCSRSGLALWGWRWPGLMDVWLEVRLMVELVPGADDTPITTTNI